MGAKAGTGRYARVYYDRIATDPKFDGIRSDRALMGSWLFVLVEAEKSWPSPAFPLPESWVPAEHLRLFADRQLVDMEEDGRYRMHGLDAERSKRSTHASDAASTRWGSAEGNAPSTPVGNAQSIAPSTAEGNAPAETASTLARARGSRSSIGSSRPEGGAGETADGLPNLNSTVAGIWESATGRTVLASGRYASEYLDDACRRHPAAEVGAAVIRARRAFDGAIPDAAQMVAAMRPLLDPLPDRRRASAAESDEERRAASRRRVQATKAGIHKLGAHEDAPDPACDMCSPVTA